MTDKALFVPIHVDGLFIKSGAQSVGPSADFSRLPHLARELDGTVFDANASHPFLTETVSDPPFQDETRHLEAGVHLHWALPDTLTRATHPVDQKTGLKKHSELEFPAVPNRWLVQRRVVGLVQAAWVIESDYIWPPDYPWGHLDKDGFLAALGNDGDDIWAQLLKSGWVSNRHGADIASRYKDRVSTALGEYASRRADIEKALQKFAAAPESLRMTRASYLFHNEDADGFSRPENPPFRLLGRCRKLGEDWAGSDPKPAYTPDTSIGNLTAVGWGEPSFAAFYPNCRSIFGFHDDIKGDKLNYSYDVFGWFCDAEQDLMAHAPKDPEAVDAWLHDHLQWNLDDPAATVPSRMICFGRVSSDKFIPQAPGDLHGKPAPKSLEDTKPAMTVAIANTGTEALSAVIASELALARHGGQTTERIAEKRKIETYLEALHVTGDLNHRQLDVGAKFRENRLEKTFTAFPGGRIWTLKAEGDTPDIADVSKRAHPDDLVLNQDLSRAISALNQSQQQYEYARRSIETVRRQVLFDWQRYMRFAYPHDDEALDLHAARDGHDLDAAIRYLREGSMAYLNDLVDGTGSVEFDTTQAHAPTVSLGADAQPHSLASDVVARVQDLQDALHTENAGRRAEGLQHVWTLQTIPAPRFYQPNDPVLLLANGEIDPSDRNGHDHGSDGSGIMGCFVADCVIPTETTIAADDALRGVIEQGQSLLEKVSNDPAQKIGVRKTARTLGHPFMLEWEAAIAPVQTEKTAPNVDKAYAPDFIRKNWRLDDVGGGLSALQMASTAPAADSVVRGRGYLTPHADQLLYQKIDAYVADRMVEFYAANAVPEDAQGGDYLQENYAMVYAWMVAKGVGKLASDAAKHLMTMQKALPDAAAFGLALDGTMGEMIRSALNTVAPIKLVSLAGLAANEALTIAMRRAGGAFINELVFMRPKDPEHQSPNVRTARVQKLLQAMEIDLKLRTALVDHLVDFLRHLTGEMSRDTFATQAGIGARDRPLIPPAHKGFAQLVAFAMEHSPKDVDLTGTLGSAKNLHPFKSYTEISQLAIFAVQDGMVGAKAIAKLLRFVHSNGYFGTSPENLAYLQELLPVMGLPVGGPIEHAIVRFVVERLHDDRLTSQVGVPDYVVEELRLHPGITRLADLHGVDFMSDKIFAEIMRAADRDPNYIHSNAALDAGKSETGTQGGAMFANTGSAGHAWSDPILTALDAWIVLKSGFVSITQTLSGFNDAMLMHRKRWQLDVADPIGFLEYRAFTEKTVRNSVGDPECDVISTGPFLPIRSGGMSLNRVRLVDSFGQITDIKAPHVITADGMDGQRDHQVMMPPRITQPARLNFRWLDGIGGETEWNMHPETTPICGWVVLNNLEGRLMIHDTSGAPLGSIDQMGEWHSPPGPTGGVMSPDSIKNAGLRRLVKWLLQEASTSSKSADGFVVSFAEICETALENIDPEGSKHSQATSLLMGRPMAVVRAAVSLECRDPLAIDQGMATFGKEIQGAPRNSHGFENVEFPVRIGEHMQLNDGVVGFWPEDGEDFAVTHYALPDRAVLAQVGPAGLAQLLHELVGVTYATRDAFLAALAPLVTDADVVSKLERLSGQKACRAPQSDWVQSGNIEVARKGRNDLNLWLPLTSSANPEIITVLMDPRGSVHASTNAMPTKQLEIPPRDYVTAMNRINISLMVAPVLTAKSDVNLPLAQETGWRWSWVSKEGTKWATLPDVPEIEKSAFVKSFGTDNADKIWDTLVSKRWIRLSDHTPDTATVLPKPAGPTSTKPLLRNGRPQDDLADLAYLNPPARAGVPKDQALGDAILRVIEVNARAIGPVSTTATFAKQEIIEGWMLLSPDDTAHYAALLPEGDAS